VIARSGRVSRQIYFLTRASHFVHHPSAITLHFFINIGCRLSLTTAHRSRQAEPLLHPDAFYLTKLDLDNSHHGINRSPTAAVNGAATTHDAAPILLRASASRRAPR
jgi:hypothetical protein